MKKKQNKYQLNIQLFQALKRNKNPDELEPLLNLNYAQYLFIIMEMKIPFEEIQFYLLKEVSEDAPHQQYQFYLKPIILQHVSQLIQRQVAEYWKYQATHKIKEQEKIYQKYDQIAQSKQNIKNRIKTLQQQLILCQKNIELCRDETNGKLLQTEYNSISLELSHWKNKKRRVKELKKLTQINSSPKIEFFRQVVEELKNMRIQLKKTLSESPSYEPKMTKEEQIRRMKQIFKTYARKGSQNTSFFSDLQALQDKLNLQTFIKFIKDFNLNRIIKVDLITKLFKGYSKGKNYIDETAFIELISEIHRQECLEEDRPYNNMSLGKYIQEEVVAKTKVNKMLSNKGKRYKYQFKASPHSGKYTIDIEQNLKEKKKSLDHLASTKNKQKYLNLSKKIIRSPNESANSSTLISGRSFGNGSKDVSYMSKFMHRKKRLQTLPATQDISQKIKKMHGRQNTEGVKGEEENEENEEVLNELKDLIEIREEDEYLNKHLLPPIKNKRILRKIHF